jgi:integration host factor subunit beta
MLQNSNERPDVPSAHFFAKNKESRKSVSFATRVDLIFVPETVFSQTHGWTKFFPDRCIVMKKGVDMTKSELVDQIIQRADGAFTYNAVELAVSTIFQGMKRALVHGERIEIRGFGSLTVKEYPSYIGRDPRTGEKIHVDPKRLPVFKVGKELKERVMTGKTPGRKKANKSSLIKFMSKYR